MSIRNLEAFFHPKSIALIGAAKQAEFDRRGDCGEFLLGGFNGPIMPVNPKNISVNGVLAYPDVKACRSRPIWRLSARLQRRFPV